MLIRVVLRAVPLLMVAVFAVGVLFLDAPARHARDLAGLYRHHITWTSGMVKCPEDWGNVPISACTPGKSPINPRWAH